MIKIRKHNVIYQIDRDLVDLYLRKGFHVVNDDGIEIELQLTEEEFREQKEFKKFTKKELLKLAKIMNYPLVGDETINELRRILK